MTNITELVQAEIVSSLMRKSRTPSILAAVDEHVLISVTDRDGRIVYANSKFSKISGYSKDELIGQDHRILNSGYHPQIYFQEMWHCLLNKKKWRGRMRNKTKSGKIYWVDSTILPYTNENGEVIGFISIRTDITPYFTKNIMLQRYREQMVGRSEVEQLKTEFLMNISHELRTPMNGILGPLQILSDADLSPDLASWAQLANASAQSLLDTLNTLIDVAQAQKCEITLDVQPVDVRGEVEAVIASFTARADAKRLPIRTWFPEDMPGALLCDKSRLKRVLSCLLDNAIKYTDEGWIDVFVHLHYSDLNHARMRFTVQDTGNGLSTEEKQRIFQNFCQANFALGRQHEGMGLGLSVVQQYVTLMGGELHCESKKAQGSRFWFELELELAAGAAQACGAEDGPFAGREVDVLVVEDHKVNQVFVERVLNSFGINVDIAQDGVEAFEAAKSKTYDLILMDVRMPRMDGLETTRKLREVPSLCSGVPIIALTANSSEEDRRNCFDAGMNDFLSKPIEPRELLNKISPYLTDGEAGGDEAGGDEASGVYFV